MRRSPHGTKWNKWPCLLDPPTLGASLTEISDYAFLNNEIIMDKLKKSQTIILLLVSFILLCVIKMIIGKHFNDNIKSLEYVLLFCYPVFIFNLWRAKDIKRLIINSFITLLVCFISLSLIHESSHIAGVYIIGQKVTDYRLIPNYFLEGIHSGGYVGSTQSNSWIDVIPGVMPYIKDLIFSILFLVIWIKKIIKNDLLLSLLYALSCVTGLFEIINVFSLYLLNIQVIGNDFNGLILGIGKALAIFIWSSFIIIIVLINVKILLPQKKRT
jgi:hypothetical protein